MRIPPPKTSRATLHLGLFIGLLAGPLTAQSLLTGTDAAPGISGHVKQFAGTTLVVERSFLAYGSFYGGVRVASGDVDNDGTPDIVTGTGPGASHVKVFSGATGVEIRSFIAFASFNGGVFVASGDVDGDGFDDVVVGTDAGGAAHVKVFSGASGAEIRSFFAYNGFSGGVRVAAADHDGDGSADIITGAGNGGAGHVKVFSGTSGAELRSFFAYAGFTGGVYVAAAEFGGDALAEIVTGTGEGFPAHVKVFNGADLTEIASFFAFDPPFTGGVRVAAGEIDALPGADLVAGTGPGAAQVKTWSGPGTTLIGSFLPYAGYDDGVFVATIAPPAVIPPPGPPPFTPEIPMLDSLGLAALAALCALFGMVSLARLRLRSRNSA